MRRSCCLLFLAIVACEADQVGREAPSLLLVPAAGSTIDFGTVVTGERVDPVTVLAKNDGNAALRFSSIHFEGSTAFELVGPPESLAPSESRSMTVRFAPSVAGPIDAVLVFESNDPVLPAARIQLTANVLEPCRIRLAPASTNFDIEETIRFTLTNMSTSECTIVAVESDPTFFPLVDPPEVPFTLPANGDRGLDVIHTSAAFRGQPVRELVVRAIGRAQAKATLVGRDRVSCLSLSRDELRFPAVEPGRRTTTTTEIVSQCRHDVTVERFVVDSADGGFSALTTVPFIVQAGARRRIEVAFEPEPGPNFWAFGTLTIETDDFADRFLRATLDGRILRPSGTVHPTRLDFEPVVYDPESGPGSPSTCASEISTVDIINVGFTTLTVRELDLTTAGEIEMVFVEIDGMFPPDWTPPFGIPPQARARVGLRYRPTIVGEQTGQLRVRHDGSLNTEIVGLVGRGEDRTLITETFEQPTQLSVDILWAIDASCSMDGEQMELISNLSQFVGYADAQGADYQMAVVEAEERSPNAGTFERCPGHPRVIHSSYMTSAVRNQAFECLFGVGTNGGGIESGLGAARAALNRALAPEQNPSINPNAGFVRPGAELVIVTISDEDDQSTIPDVVLRDFFFSVKGGQRNRVSVHAIAGPLPNGCGTAAPGVRYANVARQTNGQFYSICESDWSPLLQNLGLDVFTPETLWYLSRPADESTIVVTVDGVAVPNSPVDGWIYEPSRRVVLFTGGSVPPPGSQITVAYMPGCAG